MTYDHLDKIGTLNRQVRERYARTLLNLWLSLGHRYRRLRAKVFLREDLFQASQRQSADASKLDSRSTSLTWDPSSLYRVLIRRMAARSPDLRDWLQSGTKRIPLSTHPILGYLPPQSLPTEGQCSQRGLAEHLAGSQMGKGIKKGYVHRWIISHLQDGHGAVFPRSLLTLGAKAASFALRSGPNARHTRLLHPTELQQALVETSRQRVAELNTSS